MSYLNFTKPFRYKVTSIEYVNRDNTSYTVPSGSIAIGMVILGTMQFQPSGGALDTTFITNGDSLYNTEIWAKPGDTFSVPGGDDGSRLHIAVFEDLNG